MSYATLDRTNTSLGDISIGHPYGLTIQLKQVHGQTLRVVGWPVLVVLFKESIGKESFAGGAKRAQWGGLTWWVPLHFPDTLGAVEFKKTWPALRRFHRPPPPALQVVPHPQAVLSGPYAIARSIIDAKCRGDGVVFAEGAVLVTRSAAVAAQAVALHHDVVVIVEPSGGWLP